MNIVFPVFYEKPETLEQKSLTEPRPASADFQGVDGSRSFCHECGSENLEIMTSDKYRCRRCDHVF